MSEQVEQLPAYLRRRVIECAECCNGFVSVADGGDPVYCHVCKGTGRSPTSSLELVMHCTWAQDYDLCGEKFNLRYGVQVEASGPRTALTYGAAVHEGLAAYARGERDVARIIDATTGEFDARPQPADEWRSPGRAADLLRAFNEWTTSGEQRSGDAGSPTSWSANMPWPVEMEFLAVEEEFEVRVGVCEQTRLVELSGSESGMAEQSTPVPCTLKGRKDGLVAWHGGLWVLDWKTASDWGEDLSRNTHLLEGRMSFQFRGYAWAELAAQQAAQAELAKEHGGFCKGCGNAINPEVCHCGDDIKSHSYNSGHSPIPMGCTCGYADRSQFPKRSRLTLPLLGTIAVYLVSRRPYATERKQSKPTPRNQFHLEAYPYDARQLDEWRGEFLGMCGDVLRDHATGGWRRKRTGCGHWGRCEFYDYCEAPPVDREALLATSAFQPKLIERDI